MVGRNDYPNLSQLHTLKPSSLLGIHAFSQHPPALARISEEPWRLCAVSAQSMKWGRQETNMAGWFQVPMVWTNLKMWKTLTVFIPKHMCILLYVYIYIYIQFGHQNSTWLCSQTIGRLDFLKIGLVSIKVQPPVFKQPWKPNIFETKERWNCWCRQISCKFLWWVPLLVEVFGI